ncbi:XapX domain-containing protein [Microbacteriaceae bacterium K1510]|nr:XapX domain-containing protein [Microbacteriaceae bacterium K1510]
MKLYLFSLGAGLAVGVFYALIQVRSPAPPVVALLGLFGILIGEQLPPLVRGHWLQQPLSSFWQQHMKPHVFGHLPKGQHPPIGAETDDPTRETQG